jgi:gliding motility-associated-like protein
MASFVMDTSGVVNTPDYVYAHPQNALLGTNYTVVVKRWPSLKQQVRVRCDSAFTAITYGLGSVESYGYNAGTLVKNLNAIGTISNVLASNGNEIAYTCVGTPFKFKIRLNIKPTSLVWHFSQVPGLAPHADSTQLLPTPVDSVLVNGQWFYNFTVNQQFTITNVGSFVMPATITHPSIEGCNSKLDFTVLINVLPAPIVDYTTTFTGCVNDVAQFFGTGTTSNSVPMNNWTWNFGDATTSTLQNPTKTWTTPGTYNVSLKGVADDGCIDTTAKAIIVSLPPVVTIAPDSLGTCNGNNVTFTVQNPILGVVYKWYDAPTGGTLVQTGNSYTFNVTGPVTYYVEGNSASGCISTTRKKVVVVILPNLAIPVVAVDTVGTDMLRFRWVAVPNATGYEVSVNNGATWSAPSSGLTGLTHTVTGLQVNQTVTLLVRALGGCVQAISLPVSGTTITDEVYIPNTFTPNGDGLNDQFRVYSNVIREMHLMIFSQWGEKVFESRAQTAIWYGTHGGKPQPSGVYMYVCEMTLANGTKIQRKGSINLVR